MHAAWPTNYKANNLLKSSDRRTMCDACGEIWNEGKRIPVPRTYPGSVHFSFSLLFAYFACRQTDDARYCYTAAAVNFAIFGYQFIIRSLICICRRWNGVVLSLHVSRLTFIYVRPKRVCMCRWFHSGLICWNDTCYRFCCCFRFAPSAHSVSHCSPSVNGEPKSRNSATHIQINMHLVFVTLVSFNCTASITFHFTSLHFIGNAICVCNIYGYVFSVCVRVCASAPYEFFNSRIFI